MAAGYYEQLCRDVERARADVATATKAYARGGSCDAVNAANERLAQATYALSNPCGPVETGRQR